MRGIISRRNGNRQNGPNPFEVCIDRPLTESDVLRVFLYSAVVATGQLVALYKL